jgi:hypothetical protein
MRNLTLFVSDSFFKTYTDLHFIKFDWNTLVLIIGSHIVTCYELDGPGIESQWVRDFQHPSSLAQGPSLLYNGYRVVPGGKAAGAWHWPPIPI